MRTAQSYSNNTAFLMMSGMTGDNALYINASTMLAVDNRPDRAIQSVKCSMVQCPLLDLRCQNSVLSSLACV